MPCRSKLAALLLVMAAPSIMDLMLLGLRLPCSLPWLASAISAQSYAKSSTCRSRDLAMQAYLGDD